MMILHCKPSSPISVNILESSPPQRRRPTTIRCSAKIQKSILNSSTDPGFSKFSLCPCGRKHFLGEPTTTTTPFLPISPSHASQSSSSEVLNKLRPPKPDWYFELYGWFRSSGMERYEKEIAGYKKKLFSQVGNAEKVLEIGIGAGPNIKYYNSLPNVSILGVDPNPKMESYARKAAIEAGLKSEDFKFIHGVAECIPLEDASVDAVVTSLVMCSVTDVTQTLNEIKRILKPGGRYLFVEHVAAEDGSFLRMVQNVLDPVQQVVADGCHLTRPTGESLLKAEFPGGVDINKASLTSFFHLSPHIYGVAYN
ncbi:methyltransferase-like protein 7B [Capsella rubella]|nr:methyltransferase-like protein 7B [Capsella rubella]